MSLELKNYDPALMQGANIGVSVDLTDITDMNGNEVIELDGTTSAVNHVRIQNQATGTGPLIVTDGDDTNASMNLSAKGTGNVTLWTGGKSREVLIGVNTASAVNEVTITQSATGVAVGLAASGDDTDVTLDLDGKAAGSVRVGLTSTGGVNYRKQVIDTGGAFAVPIVLTAAQSGRVLLVDDAAGLDFTLPAVAAAQIGTFFEFLVTVTITSNSFRVTAAAGDLLQGGVWIADFDTANTGTYFTPDGSDDLIATFNGGTTGGKKGTWVRFVATTATQWFVHGIVFGDGSLATPFS